MPANERQKRAYRHRCNVWRATRSAPDPVTKKRGADAWSLVASSVICLYSYTQNVSDAIEGVGRVKRPTFFTNDLIHFVADQDVREGDIIVNTSLQPDGKPVPGIYGECHRMLGQPMIVPASGERNANYRAFQMQSVEHPPTGVGL